jgi:dynein heavy chain, axonemal
MARLQSYDKDNIAEEIIEKIRPYLSRKEFEPELVRKASKAAFGLSSWVRAMEGYDR